MRYKAPEHTADVHLAAGVFPVVDGHVNLPDDLGQGDIAGLCASGFTPAPPEPAKAKKD